MLDDMKKDAEKSGSVIKKIMCFLTEVIVDVDGDFMTEAPRARLRLYKLQHDTPKVIRDGLKLLQDYQAGKPLDSNDVHSYLKMLDQWGPHVTGTMAGLAGVRGNLKGRQAFRPNAQAHKPGSAGGHEFKLQSRTVEALGLESGFKSATFTGKVLWTAPNGTQHTYKVYQRGDIDWGMVRSKGDKNFIGKTNLEASLAGLAPQLRNGYFATLHHIGQNNKGPLVEASTHIHSFSGIKINIDGAKSKRAFDILHSQFGYGNKNPVNPVDHSIFAQESSKYWKNRAQNIKGQ